jgi:hypothetical protein
MHCLILPKAKKLSQASFSIVKDVNVHLQRYTSNRYLFANDTFREYCHYVDGATGKGGKAFYFLHIDLKTLSRGKSRISEHFEEVPMLIRSNNDVTMFVVLVTSARSSTA